MHSYTYLALDFLTIFFPLVLSFDKKVAFYRNWKYLFPAIFITGFVFIAWDVLFTINGIWEFNPKYISGIYLLHLPIEEWLFFIVVPYGCVFIYEVLKAYFSFHFNPVVIKVIFLLLIILLLVLAISNTQRTYTFVNFIFGASVLLIIQLAFSSQRKGWYLLAFVVSMIPFFLVNGALTAFPVVIYDNSENLGIRMTTIPVEDAIYGMSLLFMNYGLMDFFKQKF